MNHLRVLLDFARASDHPLEEQAGAVLAGLYGNAAYTTPPVTQAALQTAMTDFTAAIAAAKQGGPPQTADKNSRREALTALLRRLASYVQDNCNNDLATLLSSGFAAASFNHAPTPMTAPTILDLRPGVSGQLIVRVTPVANARNYEMRYALIGTGGTPGPWQDGGLCTDSRAIQASGLTPGSTYQFQVRAIGSGSSVGDWSDPVSHMSL